MSRVSTHKVVAASKVSFQKLVYTSGACAVFDRSDLVGVDESIPDPKNPMDAYNKTNAITENIVLDAGGGKG